jgi:abhydrolase domain-containing protein 12
MINTPDNETIGAWFTFSDPYYHSLPSIPTDPAEHLIPALKHSPAILYLHGNAATRAFGSQIQHIKSFSSRLGANVLLIDYRGFGDSSGTPSEAGLVTDAKAAFDWLISHGKKAEDILIIGHSLGTGVAGQLGARFGKEGIECKGIVFLSVSNISSMIATSDLKLV